MTDDPYITTQTPLKHNWGSHKGITYCINCGVASVDSHINCTVSDAQRIERESKNQSRQLEENNCGYCRDNKGKMHPPHNASSHCESGKKNHCSCDRCF